MTAPGNRRPPRDDQEFARSVEIHRLLADIVSRGGGATEVAAVLHSALGCGIEVLDTTGTTVARVPTDAALDGSVCVRQEVLVGGRRHGEIVALVEPAAIDGVAHMALEQAALALAARGTHLALDERDRFATTTLEVLIAGEVADLADVTERGTTFGWDLTRPRAVLLASIDPSPDPSPDAGLRSSTLGTIAAAARATLGSDAIVWTRSTSVAALVAPRTDGPEERRTLAEALRRELDRQVRAVTVSIGVGRRVDDPADLPRSYAEARRAVDVGRWAKGEHVTEIFDELGLERLLASTPADDLVEFVELSIGRLVEHDRSNGTDLVDTLAMWLETRNMAEAARRLHVHYNTFKNRLDRIESIVGPVVADATRSLECEIAIYVFEHYDGPWTPDATV